MKQPILKQTADGSFTIFLPEMNEQYHSLNGAFTESAHVFIEQGYLFHEERNPVVFEVGFGTGLNGLLTLFQAQKHKRQTVFYSVEKYPVDTETVRRLNYGELLGGEAVQWFEKMHGCVWGEEVQISEYFKLCKLNADILQGEFPRNIKFDVIYFDAFGPDKQPEMWTPEVFKNISAVTNDHGIFVTYSAKGQVRRDLAAAGFAMERLPGPPGKKEMLRGIKVASNL
jgi:tRNA U34 5-methylaminomethyl-2-thiouridine-forming methyltransferase MnmC